MALEDLTPPQRPLLSRVTDWVLWGFLALALMVSAGKVHIGDVVKLGSHSGNIQHFVAGFQHPDFSQLQGIVADMLETLEMALWGTVLAVVFAIPLGLAGARNVAPVWIQQPVRRLLDLLRSVPDLVVGLMFVLAVGLGPLAGVLAITLNTGGVLGKLFAEAVEQIDPQPVEGVRAVGAHPLQELVWGVLPQVAPLWTSFALYRFESSARSATILGLIGAGGIGQRLFEAQQGFEYSQLSAIIIIIVISVTFIDLVSQLIRSRLM